MATATLNNPYGVRPGQVWADLDPRFEGRRFTVLSVHETFAIVQGAVKKRVRLSRFRAASAGYRLLEEARP